MYVSPFSLPVEPRMDGDAHGQDPSEPYRTG